MKRTKITTPSNEMFAAVSGHPDFPRGYYAAAVLDGRQALSGADLEGKARKYGGWYAEMRERVVEIAADHGITTGYDEDDHGRLVWTVVGREG